MRKYLHPDGEVVSIQISIPIPAVVGESQQGEYIDGAVEHIDREMFMSGCGVVPLMPRS
jgi:hypothetical protein